ncbi:hypothetical protein SRABI106_03667 [Rahnella aquatilis]|nr:hypothetical protein SRABI106_03667 [Rahnella aquatilis]
MDTKDTCTQFQRQEMYTDQQNALLVITRMLDMFQTADFKPALDAPVWPEPRHAGFKQPHADGFEIFHNHIFALFRTHIRETQFDIASGDFIATFQEAH